ncbi:fido domain-containing protein [Gigaspora rosea]|uniref:Fido domain-containing protein n=1 Tax=Gigaspora rosea TaxID=44941 RepID=A0A397UVD3_9GLOM|nr:fido domain-containing protein [Gigaspora rosea]
MLRRIIPPLTSSVFAYGIHKDYQIKVKDLLNAIDPLKSSVKILVIDILRHVTASFTHSSCAIEGNTLTIQDTQVIWEKLKKNNLDILLEDRKLPLPGPRSLSDKPENEVFEIRNHLLATYLVSKFAELEREINLDDIKDINRVLLRDTPMEKFEWENVINYAGKFRKIEVMASHIQLTVYPHPQEVPALMKRFIEFRDEFIKNKSLHPLIIASRIFSSLNHVHPFVDGNGRVARSVIAYYLIHNGFPPIVFQDTKPGLLITCLYMAQAGHDLTFLYNLVLRSMINVLKSYQQ